MHAALQLAAHGRYSATPNPAVGCVLVRDGEIVGQGFHARAGEAHAEVAAIRNAGAAARGATAYVTLEPCNHHGRTGPCTEALIEAGIGRVVYALDDPNPGVAGGGAARLQEAGIEVTGGVLVDAAATFLRGYCQRARSGRPQVRLKVAMSLDGAAALADGQSKWITGPAARADVQRLRAESCAIVTGIGTVLADDPALTVRDPRFELRGRQPRRVVLDSALRLPPHAQMLTLAGATTVFTLNGDPAAAAPLIQAGAEVEHQPPGAGRVDIAAMLRRLGQLGCYNVLVEAGPMLVGAFLEAGCFDQLVVHVAPKLLGREARRALDLGSPALLADAHALTMVHSVRLGDDIALTFERR